MLGLNLTILFLCLFNHIETIGPLHVKSNSSMVQWLTLPTPKISCSKILISTPAVLQWKLTKYIFLCFFWDIFLEGMEGHICVAVIFDNARNGLTIISYFPTAHFFYKKIFIRKWSSEPHKILRKSPTSNTWVTIFKNTDFI